MDVPPGVTAWLNEVTDRLPDSPNRVALLTAAVHRTLRDAVELLPDGTAFVRTGDIPAMWLRDSAAQLRPLFAAAHHADVQALLTAVSRRQLEYVVRDPYANAFNSAPNGLGYHRDFADQSPWVWERKYELDSLAWTFDFATRLFRHTRSTEHLNETWRAAATLAIDVIECEQEHELSDYAFQRPDVVAHDTLPHNGRGTPTVRTGMSWSGFRPSDDACAYGYHIPSNCFTAVALDGIAEIAGAVLGDQSLSHRASQLSGELRAGIAAHGIVQHSTHGAVYAYETDGLGRAMLMDDANIPSLLSLPYLGWCSVEDPTYLATRTFVLSDANPWFFSGSAATGVGSQHTPRDSIWPLAIAMQGLTTTTSVERDAALNMLEATTAGTQHIHESFDVNDPAQFTRPWFSWADMTYVDLVLASVGMSPSIK